MHTGPTHEELLGRDGYRCDCGALIMPIKNRGSREYAVCMEGCGRLLPPLPKDERNRNLWLITFGFPDAVDRGYGYEIDGLPGHWDIIDKQRVRLRPPATQKMPNIPKDHVWALIGSKCYEFKRRAELTSRV